MLEMVYIERGEKFGKEKEEEGKKGNFYEDS